jgi:hypothetical protein
MLFKANMLSLDWSKEQMSLDKLHLKLKLCLYSRTNYNLEFQTTLTKVPKHLNLNLYYSLNLSISINKTERIIKRYKSHMHLEFRNQAGVVFWGCFVEAGPLEYIAALFFR